MPLSPYIIHVQLVTDSKWLPGSMSGCKAMHETFLGPFLSLSGLVEDSTPVRNHYYHGNSESDSISGTIQQRLNICRVRLFNSYLSVITTVGVKKKFPLRKRCTPVERRNGEINTQNARAKNGKRKN